MPKIIAAIGVLRTFLCGGWVYVTSTDDHGFHDIAMIGYLLCTLPWTLGIISMSPLHPRALKYRKIIAGSFFGTLIPLIYFFIQHKVHKVPGGMPTPPATILTISIHNLCVFRMESSSLRRRIRCRQYSRFWQIRVAGRRKGPER
jgi:Frag1/DRAM/Sfk1 family